jgi:hypothetical protein
MLALDVQVDTKTAASWLYRMHRDQIPFAAMQAINETALAVQRAEREELDESFTLRRRDWAHRNVKIRREDFAKKDKLQAIVRMEAPGRGDRSDILAKFEHPGKKRAKDGGRLAIPDDTPTAVVTVFRRRKRPRSFQFVHHGGDVWTGKDRTFMVRRPDGTGGIYQRTGKRGRRRKSGRRVGGDGRRLASDVETRRTRDLNVRTLYRFTPEAKIEKRLHFEATARQVIITNWDRSFQKAFRRAIQTAR